MVLSDVAEFSYKLSDFYHPEDESGVLWNDERLGIQWPITEDMQIITSERDSSNLPFSEEVVLKPKNIHAMTEVSDLEAVLNSARKWNAIDKNKIVLAGFSQGGIITAITAARCEKNVAGIILESPAFLIPKEAHDLFETIADIPDEYYYHFLINIH